MIEPLLSDGLAEYGLTDQLPPQAVPALDRYARELLEKNKVMNLTAIRDPEGVARLHMLDCAALLQFCDLEGKTLIDVGTGAGFPGMVLKVLVPSLEVTMLDSQQKRLAWLEELRNALGVTGLKTIHGRAEEQGREPALREQFDFAASRAVAALPVLAELCLPFVKPGGIFLAMKSVDSDAELAGAAGAIETLGGRVERTEDYRIPGTDVTHRLILIKKTRPCEKKYPRPFAKIKKNPL